ncbi:MAG: PhoPQ-activated pathogenicity-related family protein [Verrucomicrobiota bacterium]
MLLLRPRFALVMFVSLLTAGWAGADPLVPPALPLNPTIGTPLDDYVQKPDAAYAWKTEKVMEGNPSTTSIIKLTSQSWRTEQEVNRPAWDHWMVVVKPAKLRSKKAFLMISGGSTDSEAPKGPSNIISQIASATGSIVVELKMIPNQSLIFHGDGQPRKEDDLIGYAWDQFLQTGDATWLPRLPMVKSVVRAMDCLQEWSEKEGSKIEKFVVAGASKRGWTTWMTGIADQRVEAILPLVIDVLNTEASMRHHAETYGFWTEAVGEYYQHNILQRPDHPRIHDLYRIEDPYFYRNRLTMPKYIVNGSGDQFFCPTSSQFYYDDLPGEKLLRYIPNADHGLKTPDAVTSLIAYYQMILDHRPRPKLTWTFETDGSIRAKSDLAPQQVLLWQATNPQARDFRLRTIGKAFTSTELKAEPDGSWVGRITQPKEGWTAFFLEPTYDSGGTFPLVATTAVRVLPDVLPHRGIDLKLVPLEDGTVKAAK